MAMISQLITEHSYRVTPNQSDKKSQPLLDIDLQKPHLVSNEIITQPILVVSYATVSKSNFKKRKIIYKIIA